MHHPLLPKMLQRPRAMGWAWLLVLLVGACDDSARQPPSAPPTAFVPVATLQDIMTSVIDPNIDFVWNSVSTVSTASGTEERRPQTDQDWLALRQHALIVAEAANLLLVENRPVAAANATTSSGDAELTPSAIKTLVAEHRDDFVTRGHEFQVAALGLIRAIDAKNADALEKAGGEVEHACEQCHSQFWYPGDNRPK
ncbi:MULTISPECIES: cytochrome c [Methylomonas]|nr:cytochrome c [Methylomonas koyamae]